MMRPVFWGRYLFIGRCPEEVIWSKSVEECSWFDYSFLVHNAVLHTSL